MSQFVPSECRAMCVTARVIGGRYHNLPAASSRLSRGTTVVSRTTKAEYTLLSVPMY
jgi:hypothetical protein